MSRYRLRRAHADDAEAIAALVGSPADLHQIAPRESYPLTADVVAHWLEQRNGGHVLLEDERIVGYGELNHDPTRRRSYWIGHLAVHPRRRGLGNGQRLVGGLAAVARDSLRAREVWISAFADNPSGLGCYRAVGFGRVGQRLVDGRELVDMRMRFDARERVFSRVDAALFAVLAGLASLPIMPGDIRAQIASEIAPAIFAAVAACLALSAALAIALRPVLPRNADLGVGPLLRPVLYGAANGLLAGPAWWLLSLLALREAPGTLGHALALGLQMGAGWGVLASFFVQLRRTQRSTQAGLGASASGS